MKLTELKIGPKHSWASPSPENPIICTVKLSSEHATVETVLSEDQVQKVLALVQGIVAEAAKRNVADFVAQAQMIETPATVQIGGR